MKVPTQRGLALGDDEQRYSPVPVIVDSCLHLPADLPDAVVEAVANDRGLSFANPNFMRMKAMGLPVWQVAKRIQLAVLAPDGGLVVPRGATDIVRRELRKHGLRPAWVDQRTTAPLKPGTLTFRGEARDYQWQIVEAARKLENILARSPAGSGKTVAGLLLAAELQQRTIVVVWSVNLAEQWAKECARFLGFYPRVLGAGRGKGEAPTSKPVTIAVQQTLHRRAQEEAPHFGLMVCDEVQRFAATTLRQDVAAIPARWRLGLSEDERRRDKLEPIIYAQFGPVRVSVDREQLVKEGQVIPVRFRVVPTGWILRDEDGNAVSYGKKTDDEAADEEAPSVDIREREEAFIEAEDRNRFIARWVLQETGLHNRALVLVRRREHASWFARTLRASGLPTGYLLGQEDMRSEFERSQREMKAGRLRCAVGTPSVFQGLDIPPLDRGFIAVPCAGNQQLLGQQVGRFARPAEKGEPVVYYFWDDKVWPFHLYMLRRFVREEPHRFTVTELLDENGEWVDLMQRRGMNVRGRRRSDGEDTGAG